MRFRILDLAFGLLNILEKLIYVDRSGRLNTSQIFTEWQAWGDRARSSSRRHGPESPELGHSQRQASVGAVGPTIKEWQGDRAHSSSRHHGPETLVRALSESVEQGRGGPDD